MSVKRDELNANQRIAAVLDAQALPRDKIARVAGVTESSINNYRGDARYQAEVTRLRENVLGEIQTVLDRAHAELLEGARAAVRTLTALLEAEDSDGNPLHGRQHAAAEALLRAAGPLMVPNHPSSADGGSGPAHASVTFVLPEGARVQPAATVESTAEDV